MLTGKAYVCAAGHTARPAKEITMPGTDWPIHGPAADRPGTGRIARTAAQACGALVRLLHRCAATETAEPAAAPQPWPADPPQRPVISRYY